MRRIGVGIVTLMVVAILTVVPQQGRAETYMGIGYDFTQVEIEKGMKQSMVRILDAINPKLFPRSQTEKFE